MWSIWKVFEIKNFFEILLVQILMVYQTSNSINQDQATNAIDITNCYNRCQLSIKRYFYWKYGVRIWESNLYRKPYEQIWFYKMSLPTGTVRPREGSPMEAVAV